jgi:tetratricopeptide (TPR) repeat protein
MTYNEIQELVSNRATESETLEYKRAIRSGAEIATTICAMANTSGGRIVIGVEAHDRIPSTLVGWIPISNLDSGITQHLREKTKPPNAIDSLKVYDVSIPDRSPMVVTVCEVAQAHDAVWYREANADHLYLRKGSSSLPAKEREEFVSIILGRLNDAHGLAEIEMNNDNFEAAERIFDSILLSNTRDFKAWIGKLECSAYWYDSDKAIDCFRKAVNIDRDAARKEVFFFIVNLKRVYLEFTTKQYTSIDPKTKAVTREKSDIPFDGKEEIEELKNTIEDLSEGYCNEFPLTAECHLIKFTNHIIRGKIVNALTELEEARTVGSEDAEMLAIIEVEELEARWLTRRRLLLSFALGGFLIGWTAYFCVNVMPLVLAKWGGSWIDRVNVVIISAVPVITASFGLMILLRFLRLRKAAGRHFGAPPTRLS